MASKILHTYSGTGTPTVPASWATVPNMTADVAINSTSSVIFILAQATIAADAVDRGAEFRIVVDGNVVGPIGQAWADNTAGECCGMGFNFAVTGKSGTITIKIEWQQMGGAGATLDSNVPHSFQLIEIQDNASLLVDVVAGRAVDVPATQGVFLTHPPNLGATVFSYDFKTDNRPWANPDYPDNWTQQGTWDANNYVEEHAEGMLFVEVDGAIGLQSANFTHDDSQVRITVVISEYTSGTLAIADGGTNLVSIKAAGTYIIDHTWSTATTGKVTIKRDTDPIMVVRSIKIEKITSSSNIPVAGTGSILLMLANVPFADYSDGTVSFQFGIDGTPEGPATMAHVDAEGAAKSANNIYAKTGLSAGNHTFELNWKQESAAPIRQGGNASFQVVEITGDATLHASLLSTGSWSPSTTPANDPNLDTDQTITDANAVVMVGAAASVAGNANDLSLIMRLGIDDSSIGGGNRWYTDSVDIFSGGALCHCASLSAASHSFQLRGAYEQNAGSINTSYPRGLFVLELAPVVTTTRRIFIL